MLGTIRRHQVWLWWIIGGITVVSFLIFGPMNAPRRGNPGRMDSDNHGVIQGKKISGQEFDLAKREAFLDILINRGQKIDIDSAIGRRQTLIRLLLIKKQEDLGINVTAEGAAAFARVVYGPISMDNIETNILQPNGLTEADFERFLRHEAGNEQLTSAVGITGRLVTPGEAEALYRTEHEPRATSMAYFSVSNYLPQVTVKDDAVLAFFSNQVANYKIPDRVQVAYVKFNVTNQLAAAATSITNLDKIVDDYAFKMGTNNPFPEAKTPVEIKAKIRETLVRNTAMDNTHRIAANFAVELDKITTNRTAAALETLAKSKGFTPEVSMPFDVFDGPTNLEVTADFATTAFNLTPEEPFSRTVAAEDGFYVMAFKSKLPSENPLFKDVAEKVTKDYRDSQARDMARDVIIKFNTAMTNGIAQGKSFAAICAEAKVTPETLSPFALSSTNVPPELHDRVSLNVFRNVVFGNQVGTVSTPTSTSDGAFVVSIDKKLPIDEEQMKKDLPGYMANIRRGRMFDTFNAWMNAQIKQDPAFMQQLQQATEEAQGRPPGR